MSKKTVAGVSVFVLLVVVALAVFARGLSGKTPAYTLVPVTQGRQILDAELKLKLAEERLALVEKGRVNKTANIKGVESILRAPVTGTVLELLVNEGDPVVPLSSYQAGTALATLADMGTLLFKGTVD